MKKFDEKMKSRISELKDENKEISSKMDKVNRVSGPKRVPYRRPKYYSPMDRGGRTNSNNSRNPKPVNNRSAPRKNVGGSTGPKKYPNYLG